MAETDGQASRTQTTRFQYPRGDTVIGDFFTTNVYKSAALIDVIYLFRLDYGKDADVSQILREKLMAARSESAQQVSDDVYTSSVPAEDDAATANSDDDADITVDETADDAAQPAPQSEQEQSAPQPKQKQQQPQPKSAAQQSDFDIAEMFD